MSTEYNLYATATLKNMFKGYTSCYNGFITEKRAF